MIHVGVDLHQRFCYMTALDARGKAVQSGAVNNERLALKRYFRQFRGQGVQVAVEACGFWPAFREVVEPEVKRLVLVHPQRVKAIASAKLKNDRVDSETLAHLLRCDLLPESWKADRETQARRQQVRLRATLVRQRTRLKNQVHAVLHQQGLRAPVTDLLGKRGRQWLAQMQLADQARETVTVCTRLIDGYPEEIEEQNRQLSVQVRNDARARWLTTIPGMGGIFCDAAVGRDRRHPAVRGQAGAVQLRRTGAASTGVGRQESARWDYAARLSLAALDHGRSGPGSNPQFSGRGRILSPAAAQESGPCGAGGLGAQVVGRGVCHAAPWRGL
jgi:transposase